MQLPKAPGAYQQQQQHGQVQASPTMTGNGGMRMTPSVMTPAMATPNPGNNQHSLPAFNDKENSMSAANAGSAVGGGTSQQQAFKNKLSLLKSKMGR